MGLLHNIEMVMFFQDSDIVHTYMYITISRLHVFTNSMEHTLYTGCPLSHVPLLCIDVFVECCEDQCLASHTMAYGTRQKECNKRDTAALEKMA